MTAVVPPNTRARVLLPGSAEEFEVGAGSHEWQLPAETEPTAEQASEQASQIRSNELSRAGHRDRIGWRRDA